VTLQKKVLYGYGVALALVATVLVWATVNLVDLGRASDAILEENYRSILAADNMVAALERQDSACLLALLGYPEEGQEQRQSNDSQFLQWLGRARANITIAGEADTLAEVEAAYAAYRARLVELEKTTARSSSDGRAFYHGSVFSVFSQVRGLCLQLKEMNQRTMHQASAEARRVTRRAIWSTVLIGLAALIVGLAASWHLSQRLVEPVRQLIDTVRRIGEGQYDVHVAAGSADELDRLAEEFNVMASRLKAYHDLNVDQVVAEKRKGEAILRSIDDGILVVDGASRIVEANPMAGQLLGLAGRDLRSLALDEVVRDAGLLQQIGEAATGTAPRTANGNVLTIGVGEGARHLMYSITPVASRSAGLLGAVLVLHDVTRLKEVERLKSQFVMTASHELRTPLTSVCMSVGLLRAGAATRLDDKQRELLDTAHEELQRLRALIDELLDLSRIEAGRIELDFGPLQVDQLFSNVVAIFAAQAEAQGVEVVAETPPDLPAARADANKITWVLTNLVSNALRYVERGGHVTLAARQVHAQVYVSVRDDGAGILPQHQQRIFEPFVQVDGERSVQGSGLGLAICRETVRAHGGSIWVESEPGEGSVFIFTLDVTG